MNKIKLSVLTVSLLLAVGCATSKTKSARMVAPPPVAAVAAQTTYSIAPTSATASSAGSTGNIVLTVPTWTATSDSSWLSISPTSGQGNASFVWTAAANTSTAVRTGTLNIAGQLFTVTQDGAIGGGPVNNFFANATIVSGSTATVTGSNVGATKEPGEPNHAGNAGGKSVWWAWTAPASGSTTINTRNSSFDTTLGVYTGSTVSALTGIAGNDDSSGTLQSSVTFNAIAGTTYRIAVDGYNGSSGSITLTITSATTGCTYSISPTFVSIPSDSFTGNITVMADPGCTWTAVSGATWITTSSSGTGNGVASYMVQQNTGSARANIITIAGRTFTVNQAAAGGGTAGQFQWERHGVESISAIPAAVATDHLGNVIGVGSFLNNLDFGLGNLPYVGGADNYVVKLSPQGATVWAKSFGNQFDDDIRSVAVDGDDNIVVIGAFVGSLNLSGTVITSAGDQDIFVAKFTSGGTLAWLKRFGGTGRDSGRSVAVDANKDIYIAAKFTSTSVAFDSITLENSVPGSTAAAVVKLSGVTGVASWAKKHVAAPMTVYGIAVDRTGDAVVGGGFSGAATFDGAQRTSTGTSPFIVKHRGADGSIALIRTMDGGSSEVRGIATDPSNGNIVIAGVFTGQTDFGGPILDYYRSVTNTTGGILLAAYDPAGTFLWGRTPDSAGISSSLSGDGAAAIAVDTAGNVFYTGSCASFVNFGVGNFLTGNADYFVASATSSGAGRWAKRSGGSSPNTGLGIAVDTLGHVITTGPFTSSTIYFDNLDHANGGSASTTASRAPFFVQYSN